MKYQKEVEVDITPVPEDLVDVEELLRIVLEYINENMYKYGFGEQFRWDDVKEKIEELGDLVEEIEEE